ncbi:MAG: NUMOD4 motif-containing HNH endonuclease [Corallococcus sp.]|nr:NUMOD4 motif-containing HNH endonuclease [Corallococcus sp.]MCM1359094.1 NUMOD4 motif-containing HNH endonuclease [Corallococcus sp.]MCM1395083.1 NUMOD4 motif-containing HNH endonuclease [Corallococcus sp.]
MNKYEIYGSFDVAKEQLMTEQWKKVQGHANYEVSDQGRVRNVTTGKILKPFDSGNGYLRIDLGHACRVKVHRLVAAAFCPNRKHRPVVNHINRDKHDNRACNLEWVTYAQNTAHWQAIEELQRARRFALEAASGDALPY